MRHVVRIGAVTAIETIYAAGFEAETHRHDHPYLNLVVFGSYTERSREGGQLECAPFATLLHPAGETHSDRFHTATACLNIEMGCGLEGWHQEVLGRLSPTLFPAGSIVPFLAARLYASLRSAGSVPIQLLEELIGEAMGTSEGRGQERRLPPWLLRAQEQIATDVTSPSIRSLAADAGVHPVYFARAFRRHFGCGPAEYRRRLRLRRAAERLVWSCLSVSRVAADAGYADQSHFCRAFGNAAGASPREWRNWARGSVGLEVSRDQDNPGVTEHSEVTP